MAQIKSFGILQTAKFMAVMYFIMSCIFVIPMALFALTVGFSTGEQDGIVGSLLGGVGMLLIPIFYAIFGFIFVAIGCWVYNLVAGFVGGIEVDLE